MTQEPTVGPMAEITIVEESNSNYPPLRGDTAKYQSLELSDISITAPTPNTVQHPKPHPTPNQCEVF